MSNINKTVIVRTIKVPIVRDDSEKGYTESIDYAACEIKSEEKENIEGWDKIPTLAKKVANFNERQSKYLENDPTRDYILKKLIIKQQS